MLKATFRFLRYTWGRDYLPPELTKFVIIALSRTGTNLLAAMLDSHPDIVCHHELFNPGEIHRSLRHKAALPGFGTIEERDADPWAFLARVFAFPDGARVVGFKLLARQGGSLLPSLLLDRRVRKIVLHRRHWLEQYVSQMIAEKTNVWSLGPEADDRASAGQPPVRIRVEAPELLRFIRKRKSFYRMVHAVTRTTGQPSMTVAYEDLDHPDLIRRMLDFLGVDPAIELEKRTRKQGRRLLEDQVENFAELRHALQATAYSHLIQS